MRRVPIDFRALLERVLPLDGVSVAERDRLRELLDSGTSQEQERATYDWLRELVERGSLRLVGESREDDTVALRYQVVSSLEIWAVRFSVASPVPGLLMGPAPYFALRGRPPSGKLLQLQELDRRLLGQDEDLPGSRSQLLQAIERNAVEIADADSSVFFFRNARAEREAAHAPPLGEFSLLSEWTAKLVKEDDSSILVCNDISSIADLREEALKQNIRSMAAVAIHDRDARIHGYLELRSSEPEFFNEDRLALLALAKRRYEEFLSRGARLENLVFVDTLTGAFNVSYFHRTLEGEVARARREHNSLALCIADIDDFKRFNSLYGYDGGDRVLIEVARALRGELRPFDSVTRWGGEEFAIILAAPVGREEAEIIGDRLRNAVSSSEVPIIGLDGEPHRVTVTISVGIALYPSDADDPEKLWKAANKALLQAKRPPKNRTVFFSDLAKKE